MAATIMDICRETGVSIATVSRVLNKSTHVLPETRAKVLAAIARLGYKPNAAARNLSARRSSTLGVIFHQMTSGFYATVMSGLELEARGQGYHVLITLAHHADPERTRYFDMLDEARVDGLIILDSTLDAATIARLKSYGRPIVTIQKKPADPELAAVSCANEDAACAVVEHLLSLGRRDLLLVTGPAEAEDSNLRMEGCLRALRKHRLSPEKVRVICGKYSAHEALLAFRKHRKEKGLPQAIFCFNDDMALAIMKELRITGVRVPDQVAVAGFDGLEYADYTGLSTVQVPMMDLGREAVRLCVERLRNPAAPARHVILPCPLVVRESSSPQ